MKRHNSIRSLFLTLFIFALALPLHAAGIAESGTRNSIVAGGAAKASSPRRHGVTTSKIISGIVMSQTRNEIVVRTRGGDASLVVTPQTRISSGKATVLINVSDQVRAQVSRDTKGANVAVSIEVEPAIVELHGVIEAIAGATLTIRNAKGSTTASLDDKTIVVIKDAIATAADLAVGDVVEIHGLPQSDGSVLALLVVAEAENIEIHGVIEAVDTSSITVTTDDGAEITVSLSPDTAIRVNGHAGTAADLHAGQRVEIDAQRASDGSLAALVVKVENADELLEINGIVTESTGTSLTIRTGRGAEVMVAIGSDTIIMKDGHALPAVQINADDRVEVKATKAADGTLAAVRIFVEGSEHDLLEIHGVITGVTGSVLAIMKKDGTSVSISIDAQTIIRAGDHSGSLADLVAGASVEVAARSNADGSLTAIAITLEAEDEDDGVIDVEGLVAATTDSSITVTTEHSGDLTVTVNAETVIRKGDAAATLADIQVGDKVEVEGVRTATAIIATVIELEHD